MRIGGVITGKSRNSTWKKKKPAQLLLCQLLSPHRLASMVTGM